MARYLVGRYNNTWDFMTAYEKAQDGDTIEFEDDYYFEWPTDKEILINKSLNFVGHVIPKPNGNGMLYRNTIKASIKIISGVKVTFENLWFTINGDYTAIQVLDGAEVNCKQVYFEIAIEQNNKYFIFVNSHSKMVMENVGMTTPENCNAMIKILSSKLSITNSTILAGVRVVDGSKISFDKVNLQIYNTNAMSLWDSEVTVKNCTVKARDSKKDYPLIWLRNTIWKSCNSVFSQPNVHDSVCLDENVLFDSRDDHFTSLIARKSNVRLSNAIFDVILSLEKGSYGLCTSNIDFLGKNNGKIDLYISDSSTLFANQIITHRKFNPNFRVSNSSYLQIKNLSYPEGDIADLNYVISDDSEYVLKTPKAQIQPIDNENNALEELNNLVGLDKVKQEIKKMVRMVDFNKKRVEKGLPPEKQTLHSVFMGNPGTGKTTVARLLGEVLYQNGVLSGDSFRFVEATESDLISSNVGGTAEQTRRLLEKAKGGILFIDEAYTLHKKQGVDHGIEAINTILKYMEDNRDDIMIIFAGYTKEMEQFLQTNPGLKSRVPNTLIFEDYSNDEIVQLGQSFLDKRGYKLENSDYYAQHVKRAYDVSLDKSNGRWIRNLNEKLIKTFAARVYEQNSEDIETIMNVDIDTVFEEDKYKAGVDGQEDAMVTLDNLIGISKVKEQVKQFIDMAEFNKKRAEQGGTVDDTTLHSLFLGNPGTGKTTVARIVGSILYQKGVISQNKFIEVSRSDLVGGYIGHTAIKTKEVLESALGGVLFIDEAYTLSSGGANDFGKEAIDEILKFMEDHRRDIVIIFAGYTKEMAEFLETNSGLRSRIPTTFDFEDYTPEEIVQIGLLGLHKQDYEINEALYAEVVTQNYSVTNDHSNGRWVRNLNERLLRHVSTRVNREGSTDYNTITDQDIENVRER